uniref:Uncharacterized protein n=1 Tax=Parascaris equorum TaxID=6256 RepID=A0A914RC16_PAREQ
MPARPWTAQEWVRLSSYLYIHICMIYRRSTIYHFRIFFRI